MFLYLITINIIDGFICIFSKKLARRQDRKIIKIEAAHGSDRQTFIVKRDYELRVRDVMEEASKTFKIPVDQVILYWKVNIVENI